MATGRIMAQHMHRPPPPPTPGLSGAELTILILAALWLAAGILWMMTAGAGLSALLVLLLPPVILVLAAVQMRAVRLLRARVSRLAHAVADLQANAPPSAPPPAPAQSAAPPRDTTAPPDPSRARVARDSPPPQARPRPVSPDDEPQLALAAPADEAPLARADLVRALHFPEDDRDTEGFAALRRALGNREVRQLIQAAQDLLTLMSQDGIYMDDLVPDQARPEIWRRFARGERGWAVAQLGGVHDRAALGAVMRRMREDTIFRDTAHHFLRLFDRILSEFEPDAQDEEIIAISGTRTARAFMLVGRAAGVFG